MRVCERRWEPEVRASEGGRDRRIGGRGVRDRRWWESRAVGVGGASKRRFLMCEKGRKVQTCYLVLNMARRFWVNQTCFVPFLMCVAVISPIIIQVIEFQSLKLI